MDTRAPSGFRLDPVNGKLGGVCSGIANRFEIDPLFVRLGFVIAGLASFGTAAVVYLAIWLLAQ
ncbi:recombinase RecF [Aurantiacibacter luteus]|uniref:Recombinase RecF n=1 Tax=Aurantiacibacter luteus TaxID=1581420 RepID=A0A0G9MTP7_9SPHN|nr:recombinase RecF [Aurantiacibacter luteus]